MWFGIGKWFSKRSERKQKSFWQKKKWTCHRVREGSLPLRATPLFVRTPQEADRLVWNSFCDNNLATYIHKLSASSSALLPRV